MSIKLKGFILAILAALFWGVSGTLGQFLFQQKSFNVEWLITIRMLIAGAVLVAVGFARKVSGVRDIWKNKTDVIRLLIFSILGVVMVQYTYFLAIEASNSATATVLQYMAPVLIAIFLSLKLKRMPTFKVVFSIILALTGTILLVTHGDIRSLSISTNALIFGILGAVTLAFYTLYPVKLLNKYQSLSVVGWGMLVGGLLFSAFKQPWDVQGTFDFASISSLTFIIVFATIIAFLIFAISVQYIGGQKASLLACVEPLAATLLAVYWLQTPFGLYDWIGCFSIVISMILIGLERKS